MQGEGASQWSCKHLIVAHDLIERLSEKLGTPLTLLGTVTGAQLAGCQYKHPLFERTSPVVIGGDYITTESGTGLVHTAPGHGTEDYQVRGTHAFRRQMLSAILSKEQPILNVARKHVKCSLVMRVLLCLLSCSVFVRCNMPCRDHVDQNKVQQAYVPFCTLGILACSRKGHLAVCTALSDETLWSCTNAICVSCLQVGLKNNLPLLSPVDDAGVFTEEAGEFKGLQVTQAALCLIL